MPRSAKVQAHLEEEGKKIRMTFEGFDLGTITFNADTGASGPKAFEKLRRILDVEQGRKLDKHEP